MNIWKWVAELSGIGTLAWLIWKINKDLDKQFKHFDEKMHEAYLKAMEELKGPKPREKPKLRIVRDE